MSPGGPRTVMLTTDAVGGVWRYCLELARGFSARGASIVLIAMGPAPDEAQRAEARALGVTLLDTGLPLDWLAQRPDDLDMAAHELADLALQIGADTIQLHTPALATGTGWPAPVIAMAHSCVGTWWRAVRGNAIVPGDLAWRVNYVASGLAAADAIIAPTEAFATALHAAYGRQWTIQAIPNGRHTTPLPRDPQPHALTAGRLWDEGKNIPLLDQAAASLSYPVYAAGPVNGPNGAHVACDNVRLLGVLDEPEMARQYARAAVFVSTARYEPFGLAVLEAAQGGAALVLSNIPTFRELWDGAATFVDPDDAAGLRRTLQSLLQDSVRCAALGESARKRAGDYGAERMVAATWSVHCNLWRARLSRAA